MTVEWLPFELHPEIPPEGLQLPAHARARFGGMSERLQQMARESGRDMVTPDRIPSSRRALEASEYAREQGRHEAFHRVVFRKFYGEGQDISRWDVLRSAAEEVGLDAGEMQQKSARGDYKRVVDAHIEEAHKLGITGVPAYILGHTYLIMGAQPYEQFQKAMAQLKADGQRGLS